MLLLIEAKIFFARVIALVFLLHVPKKIDNSSESERHLGPCSKNFSLGLSDLSQDLILK